MRSINLLTDYNYEDMLDLNTYKTRLLSYDEYRYEDSERWRSLYQG